MIDPTIIDPTKCGNCGKEQHPLEIYYCWNCRISLCADCKNEFHTHVYSDDDSDDNAYPIVKILCPACFQKEIEVLDD